MSGTHATKADGHHGKKQKQAPKPRKFHEKHKARAKKKRTDDRKPQDPRVPQESKKRKAFECENSASPHAVPAEVLDKVIYSDEPALKYISQVGQGTYGKVYKAVDRTASKLLAMKRLRLEMQHEGFPITAAREIKLLQVLRHPNIVKLSEIVVSKNEIYMSLDYIEHDLAGLLLNNSLKITPANAKSLARQTLAALAYLHTHFVLHRDIKGSNLLVTANGTVKLADFGLARYIDLGNASVRYTNRVISLWYRPPELLLGSEHYGSAVDVWSVGCILVEIFKRAPLFHGKDEVSQIQAVLSIMGIPTREEWPEYYDLPWYPLVDSVVSQMRSPPMSRFKRVFAGHDISPACFDLATKLLAMNPANRISAQDALRHDYFNEEPREKQLELHMEKEWHDWEAKKRKRDNQDEQQQNNQNHQQYSQYPSKHRS